jgi:S-DNA-T family DNA segregation ATPase FtsK/SpoIIIE
VLPGRVGFEEAWELRDNQEIQAMPGGGRLWAMAAIGGDQLTALGPNLAEGTPGFVIAGPARSGRSTALLAMIRSFLSVGTQVILAVPGRQSPLRRLEHAQGVVGFFGEDNLSPDSLEAALDRFTGPGVIVVDDAELLRTCDAGDILQSVVRNATGRDVGIVIAGNADDVCGGFSGWQVELKKARRGLLLSPQNMSDADLIGVRLQRGSIGQTIQPGRGLLHLGDGEARTVQVPLTAL